MSYPIRRRNSGSVAAEYGINDGAVGVPKHCCDEGAPPNQSLIRTSPSRAHIVENAGEEVEDTHISKSPGAVQQERHLAEENVSLKEPCLMEVTKWAAEKAARWHGRTG